MVFSTAIKKPTTKDKILLAALKLFIKNGYEKTTTNEIAEAAGFSIGAIYGHFDIMKVGHS